MSTANPALPNSGLGNPLSGISDTFNDLADNKVIRLVFKFAIYGILGNFTIDLLGDLVIEPLLFSPLHETTNEVTQAWMALIQDHLGWITDWVGLTGDAGFLHTEFMQNFLGPYMDTVSVKDVDAEATQGLYNDIMNGDFSLNTSPIPESPFDSLTLAA